MSKKEITKTKKRHWNVREERRRKRKNVNEWWQEEKNIGNLIVWKTMHIYLIYTCLRLPVISFQVQKNTFHVQ